MLLATTYSFLGRRWSIGKRKVGLTCLVTRYCIYASWILIAEISANFQMGFQWKQENSALTKSVLENLIFLFAFKNNLKQTDTAC